jgi:hypothetical protein
MSGSTLADIVCVCFIFLESDDAKYNYMISATNTVLGRMPHFIVL